MHKQIQMRTVPMIGRLSYKLARFSIYFFLLRPCWGGGGGRPNHFIIIIITHHSKNMMLKYNSKFTITI